MRTIGSFRGRLLLVALTPIVIPSLGPTAVGVASGIHVTAPLAPIIVDCEKLVHGSGLRFGDKYHDMSCRDICSRRCAPKAVTRKDWKTCMEYWGAGSCQFGGQVLTETIEGWACNGPETDVVINFSFDGNQETGKPVKMIDHYWYISRIAVRWYTELPPYDHCVNGTRHARIFVDGFETGNQWPPRKWCRPKTRFQDLLFNDVHVGETWIDRDAHWAGIYTTNYTELGWFKNHHNDFSVRALAGSCGARVLGDPARAMMGLYHEIDVINWDDYDGATLVHTVDPDVWNRTATTTSTASTASTVITTSAAVIT